MNDYIELYSIGSRFPGALLCSNGVVIDLECNPFKCDPFNLKEPIYE